MPQYPPLYVFDENDEHVGEAMLEEILDKKLIHRVIHVVVEDENGNVLLQLRGPNVKTDKNTWDFAVGGYVDAGENYKQAALRELKEELGIDGFDVEDLGVKRESILIDEYDINRFVGEFKLVIPRDYQLVVEEKEVAEIKWFTKDELKELIRSGSPKITQYFMNWTENHYFSHENNKY